MTECQCPVPSSGRAVCVCRECHGAPWQVHVFSSASAFDKHIRRSRHLDPRVLVNRKTGEPVLVLKTDRKYPYWGRPDRGDEDAPSRQRRRLQGGFQ